MAWLQPEPRLVLSKLPLLESVTVYSMFDPPDWENEPTVPEDSFSSLRRLSMHEVDPYDVLQVLRTRHMFQQVTSLVLDFNIDEFPLEESIDFWLINDFFPILSNIPRLCDFSVKIPSLESEETLMVIRPLVLDILSALPLQSVTLGNMECPFIPWPDNFEIAWPLVTKLSMPDQTVSLDFLHPFAALPKLEYLELKLDVEWIFDPTIPEPGPRAPLHTLVTTHYQVANRNVWDADQIVRWLLTHWPNLSRMVCPDPDPTKEPADTLDREYFDLLNRRLKELRVLEHATE
ncbi:hypothetical protein BDV93DRAFT_525680 [Ceratobasidium sp. AG-I]|nr:hypothetical protein BDV93DRAFT_525680 [Ceratobasidium sp. AG-I]